jgi:hypothetical protein
MFPFNFSTLDSRHVTGEQVVYWKRHHSFVRQITEYFNKSIQWDINVNTWRGRMLEGPVVARRTATLSTTTWHTVNLHCSVLHEMLCSLECVKRVCRSVKDCDVFCVTVVFVEELEFCQQSYSQGHFSVYQHLNDLNSERSEVKDFKVLRYNLIKKDIL